MTWSTPAYRSPWMLSNGTARQEPALALEQVGPQLADVMEPIHEPGRVDKGPEVGGERPDDTVEGRPAYGVVPLGQGQRRHVVGRGHEAMRSRHKRALYPAGRTEAKCVHKSAPEGGQCGPCQWG